jgi:hypothetical protein
MKEFLVEQVVIINGEKKSYRMLKVVTDIEKFRQELKEKYHAEHVYLAYSEREKWIPTEMEWLE